MGKELVLFCFLMHVIPNEYKKDNTVYHLKLHVSNRSPVFQVGELNLRLFVYFLASRRSQNTCLHKMFYSGYSADCVIYVLQDHI